MSKAEYWAQKAADSGDADACALLAQIKITNPVSLDYPQAKVLAEKAAQAGSKEGEVTLAHSNHIQMHYRTNLPNLYQHLIAMS